MSDSPASILFSTDGYEVAVKNSISIPTGTRGLLSAGSDGTTARFLKTDNAGKLIVIGDGTAGSPSSAVFSIQGITSGIAVKTDSSATTQPVSGTFWQTTQPISGTVTANIGTSGSLALDATLAKLTITQSTALGSNTQTLMGGSVTTAAPTYTTGNINPLSLTTSGLLRIDGSGVTQPVSGTIAATQSGTWTVQPGNTANTTPWLITLNQGGNSATITGSNALKVDGSAVTQPISGTITANIGTSGSLALDATLAKLTISQGAVLGSNTQALIGGSVTTSTPSYTTGQISPLSLDTSGALRVTNTSSGYADGYATTAAPTYTNNTQNHLSLTTAGALRIDGSAVTQPISGTVATTQSGTWTVQPGNTANTTPWLATISQGGNSVTVTGSNALKIDGSATTQPISGTITANIGTSGSLALDATLAKLTISQSTALGSNTQALIGGSVTTAAPTYTTGNINPLSLTTSGALRIDGSGATQPISGTVTANAGTGNFTVIQSTAASLRTQTASESATGSAIPSLASFTAGSVTTAAPTYTTGNLGALSLTTSGLLRVDGSGSTQPVSGTITANIGTSGSLALDATLAKLTISTGTTLGSNTVAMMGGSVTTAAPTYTTGQINALSLTTGGLLRVDNSGVTQTVSGTVSVSGTVTVDSELPSAAALADAVSNPTIPTVGSATLVFNGTTWDRARSGIGDGASATGFQMVTPALFNGSTYDRLRGDVSNGLDVDVTRVSGTVAVTQSGTWTVQPGNTANTTPWLSTISQGGNSATVSAGGALKVDGSAATQPVSGTVTANIGTISTLATETSLAKLTVSQGTALGSNTQALIGGSVTTAAPSYTTGQISPLSLDTAGALRVTGSLGSNASVSTTASSPPSSATYIGGSVTTASPSYTTGQMNAFSLTTSGLLRVDGSGATQPISGTITANIGTSGSLALDATVTKLTVAQGASLGSNTQALIGGSVTTAAPSYTTGQISPLSLDTAGALRVTGSLGSNASVSTTGAAPPASATYIGASVTTAAPSYTTGQISALSLDTSGSLRVINTGSSSGGTASIFGSAYPTDGTAIGFTDGTSMRPGKVFDTDTGGGTEYNIGISLRKAASGGSVELGTSSDPIRTDPTGSTIQPVSGTITANIGTIATLATETSLAKLTVAQGASLGSNTQALMGGSVTTAAPTYTNGQISPLSLDASGALRVSGIAGGSGYIDGYATTAAPSYTNNTQNHLSLNTAGALRVDNSGITQPVSGTVAATQSGTWNISNISGTVSLPTGAATETSLAKLTLAQGSTTSGQTGNLNLAAVTTAAPAYTNGQSSPLSLDTSGALRVTGSLGSNASVSTTGSAPPASATYIGGSVTTAAPSYTTGQISALSLTTSGLLRIDGSGATQPVSGTITANIGTSGSLALDATLAKLTVSQSTALGSNTQAMVGGSVTTASPTYTTGNINPLSLTTAGALRTDSSATTQPISGTVAATQSGTWNITNVSGTVSLPTGAATEASLVKLTLAQGSTTSGQTGALTLGAVTTASPSYTTGQSSPLSLDATGSLRVNVTAGGGSNASVSTTGSAPPASATYIGGSVTTAAPSYTTGQMSAFSLTTGGLLRIDGSGATQPVSGTIAATQSGTWTVQPGNTANTTPWLTTISQGGNAATVSASGALKVDGSAATQPVSGTITANIGTSGSLALDATLAKLTISQSTALGSNTQAMVGGSVTTAAPTYTTGNINPLSLTTAGLLRVDGSGATQPVSGTVTANAGTGNFTVIQSTAASLRTQTAAESATGSATPSLALLSGGAVTTAAPTYTTGNLGSLSLTTSGLLRIDGSGVTQPVSGTITANIGTSGSLALDATLAKLTISQSTALGSNTQALMGGSVTTAAPTYTTGNINPLSLTTAGALRSQIASEGTIAAATGTIANLSGGAVTTAAPSYTTGQMNPLSLTTTGLLRVDNSGVTQPVSGTITANIGTSGSLALDATLAKLTVSQGTALGSNTQALIGGSVTTAAPTYTTGQISPLSLDTGGALRVSGTVTATNASVSTTGSSPPASATYAGGSVTTAAPSYTTGQMSALSLTTSGLLRIDGSGATQPVSGTITANIGTSGSLALDATLAKLTVAQSTALGSNTQALIGGSVTTAAPTYTTGNINPLSLTTAGALRTDSSGTTQPVSGTVTANAGTGNFTVIQSTAASLRTQTAAESATGSAPPSLATLNGGSVTTAAPSYTTGNLGALSLTTTGLLRVDNSGVTQPVSGTITANIGTSGSLALDATLAKLTVSQSTALGSNTQALMGGSVTTAAPTYTTGNINPLSLTTAGALRIDGSGTTQPISGTVTANAGTGNFTVVQSTASSLNATIVGTTAAGSGASSGLVTIQGNASGTPIPVSGTVTATNASVSTTGAAPPASATYAGGSVTTAAPSYTTGQMSALSLTTGGLLRVDASGTTQGISGTVTANIGTSGSLALDATLAKLTISTGTALGSNTVAMIGASVTTAAPSYTTGQINALSLTTGGLLRVDNSGVTQPVSGTIAATQSGTWTVQPGNTANTTPWLATISQGGNSATVSAGGALKVDGSAATQPVSGTITANIGTIATLATETSLAKLTISQGTALGSNTQSLMGGSVTTAAPTYTTGQISPLSLDTGGALRVSGTVTATNASVSTTGSAPPASATYAGGSVTTAAPSYTTGQMSALSLTTTGLLRVDGSVVTQPVSGTVTANIGTIGTIATEASLAKLTISQSTALGSNTQAMVAGSVTTAAPTYTTGNINPLSLTTTGSLRVDGSGSTQPVSGTVATTQSGTWTVQPGNTANTTPWLSTISQGGNSATVSAGGALKVDGSAATQPVSGTITANIGTSGSLALDATLAKLTISQSTALGSNTVAMMGGSVTTAAPSYTTGNINPLSLTTAGSLRVQIASEATTATSLGTVANLIGGSVTTAAPSYTTGQMNALSLTTTGLLRVDNSGVTQPVSGTITANIGTSGSLALDATVAKLTISQGTALGSNTQALMGGSVTTAAPTYTTGQISPLSLDTTGALRVTGSLGSNASVSTTAASPPASATYIGGSVTTAAPSYTTGQMNALSLTTAGALRVDNSANTQPVSGTITANIGTSGSLALDATVAKLTVAQSTALGSNTQALIGGSVTTAAPTYTTGNINPLSLTTTGALRSQIASEGTIATATGTIASMSGGAVTTAAPSYTTGQMNPLSLTTAGALRIDGSSTTQPVSGTITANIGTSGSLALDATVAKLTIAQGTALGSNTQALIGGSVTTAAPTYTTGQISPLSLDTTGALRVTGSLGSNASVSTTAASPPASATYVGGSVTTAAPTYTTGQINPLSIDTTGALRVVSNSGTAALSNVSASVSSVTVLAANTVRKGATIWNDSTSVLYVKFGTTASATSCTVKLIADDYFEVPFGYQGIITGIWVSATGSARITEIS